MRTERCQVSGLKYAIENVLQLSLAAVDVYMSVRQTTQVTSQVLNGMNIVLSFRVRFTRDDRCKIAHFQT